MTDAPRVLRSLVAFACCAMAGAAMGQDFTVHGYVDMRAGWSGDETAWNDGGLGKTRFGEGGFVCGGAASLSGAPGANCAIERGPPTAPNPTATAAANVTAAVLDRRMRASRMCFLANGPGGS